jgi:aminocarboxymuconate-semialdehyde decarboxylase
LSRVARLRVAVAHGGGSFPAYQPHQAETGRLRPDLCAIDNYNPANTWAASGSIRWCTMPALELLVQTLGADG